MVAKEVKYKGYTIRIDKSDLRPTYKYSAVMTAPDGTMWTKVASFPSVQYITSKNYGKENCHKTIKLAILDGMMQVDNRIARRETTLKKLFKNK